MAYVDLNRLEQNYLGFVESPNWCNDKKYLDDIL